MLNKDLLKKKIEDSGLRTEYIRYNLDLSFQTFKNMLNGESEFRRPHIQKLQQILRLTDEEVMDIFFADELTNE